MKRFSKSKCVCSISPQVIPAYYLSLGECAEIETKSPMEEVYKYYLKKKEILGEVANWSTGPIYIKQIKPGDILAVKILDIKVEGPGVISLENTIKILEVNGDKLTFGENLSLPINPMIGVVAIAPKQGELSCHLAGDCGGNMDIKDIGIGAIICLPVAVPGALLVLGDVHATQGDGEIGGQGAEINAKVLIRIGKDDKSLSRRPYIYKDGYIMTVGWGKNVEEAIKLAVKDMINIIVNYLKIAPREAEKLIGLVGDVKIGQVVTPIKTVRVTMSMDIFQGRITPPEV